MSYAHLSRNERQALGILVRCTSYTQKELASKLGVNQSTISRELRRNGDSLKSYGFGWSADRKSRERRKQGNQCHRKLGVDGPLTRYTVKYLKKYWSPEEIAGRLKLEEKGYTISAPAIYEYIYTKRPDLVTHLRFKRGIRKRRYGPKKGSLTRFEAAGKRSIGERPEEVKERACLGHWEGDTMVGRRTDKARIHTHVERRSRYLVAGKLKNGEALSMARETIRSLQHIPAAKRVSITYDNGKENQQFRVIEQHLNLTIYFAHPYSSCERGTNENTNGLLRQFFPKGTDFASVEAHQLTTAVHLLNRRPRKCLGYRMPHEVFTGDALRT